MKVSKWWYGAAGLAVLVAFFVGFFFGFSNGFHMCVDIGIQFLEDRGIPVDVDRNLVERGLLQFKNNIGRLTDSPLVVG